MAAARRYWEHLIRDEIDFERHVDLRPFSPVKHGWVAQAVGGPHSSIQRYLRQAKTLEFTMFTPTYRVLRRHQKRSPPIARRALQVLKRTSLGPSTAPPPGTACPRRLVGLRRRHRRLCTPTAAPASPGTSICAAWRRAVGWPGPGWRCRPHAAPCGRQSSHGHPTPPPPRQTCRCQRPPRRRPPRAGPA